MFFSVCVLFLYIWMKVDAADLKEELNGEDEFDLSEDLESSLQLFNGLLHSKVIVVTNKQVSSTLKNVRTTRSPTSSWRRTSCTGSSTC